MDSFHTFDLNYPPNEIPSFDLNEEQNLGFEGGDDFSFHDQNQEHTEEVELNSIMNDTTVEGLNEDDEDSEHVDMSQGEIQQRKNRSLSNEERRLIYNALLRRSENGKLTRGTTKAVSSLFSVPIRTIQRIWNRAKGTPSNSIVDLCDKRAKNSGRKRVTIDLDRIANIPLSRRTTLRSLASALNVSHSTLHHRLKEGNLRRHSSAIKPLLKEEHKIARLKFCMSMLEATNSDRDTKFVGMYNIVHIDEKWFYMSKKSTSYYLHIDEEEPVRSCQSKNFIGKVMFLAAIARPRFDEQGNEVFSGKIGVFPFVTTEPAIRRSRNREAGTLETKPITSVKKETIRTFLLEKVIPAIQDKWPNEELGQTIFIQQDNARTHVRPNDEEFRIAASQNGFDIRLLCQPANSPDMNVLDLGFFNALQSLKDKECVRTVDELIGAVERAFEAYPAQDINKVFLSLQQCMKKTMKYGGLNTYRIPHMYKDGLQRNGCLPTVIDCERDLVESAKAILEARHD